VLCPAPTNRSGRRTGSAVHSAAPPRGGAGRRLDAGGGPIGAGGLKMAALLESLSNYQHQITEHFKNDEARRNRFAKKLRESRYKAHAQHQTHTPQGDGLSKTGGAVYAYSTSRAKTKVRSASRQTAASQPLDTGRFKSPRQGSASNRDSGARTQLPRQGSSGAESNTGARVQSAPTDGRRRASGQGYASATLLSYREGSARVVGRHSLAQDEVASIVAELTLERPRAKTARYTCGLVGRVANEQLY
jgi:hypothetical protein